MKQKLARHFLANDFQHSGNIVKIANVHYLNNDTLRMFKGIFRLFPPEIFGCEFFMSICLQSAMANSKGCHHPQTYPVNHNTMHFVIRLNYMQRVNCPRCGITVMRGLR